METRISGGEDLILSICLGGLLSSGTITLRTYLCPEEQRLSCESDSRSAGQDINSILRYPIVTMFTGLNPEPV